ncbi:MAG: HEAT repeat domain-containing protein [Myxococcota bacterium]
MNESPKEGAAVPSVADDLRRWLRDFVKGIKGLRVYASNNETLHRYLQDVYSGLNHLLEEQGEFTLMVREDRLMHQGVDVLVEPDRLEGLPFLLFRNAFRRLTFIRGMQPEEIVSLMRAITTDYAVYDGAGEDLVTALWRLQLPHLRYVTIDTLTAEAGIVRSSDERAEIERLQGDIENIVAAVYRNSLTGSDIVSGLSISKEDLHALREVQEEPEEELERLDQMSARAVLDIDPGELNLFKQDLMQEGRDRIIQRTMDVLVRILFNERSGREAFGAVSLLQQLLDALLLGQRFVHATELVRRLHRSAQDGDNLQELHVSRQLLLLFANKSRIIPLLAGLNDRVVSRSVSELLGFLRALGPNTVPGLLAVLPDIESPVHRRVIKDLIIELGVPSMPELLQASRDAEWFVLRDILAMAEHHPPEDAAIIVEHAIEHPHPRVREAGTKMLRNYGFGAADDRLAIMLRDTDHDVRKAAQRLAVVRAAPVLVEELRRQVEEAEVGKDPRELRHLYRAFAATAQGDAVEVLVKILNQNVFSSLKNADAPVAAAMALGNIEDDAARAGLQRGTRSLVARIREACRRALERRRGSETVTLDLDESSGDLMAFDIDGRPDFVPAPPSFPESAPIPSVNPEPPQLSTLFHRRVDLPGDHIPDPYPEPTVVPSALTDDLVLTDELPLLADFASKPLKERETKPSSPPIEQEVLLDIEFLLPTPKPEDS